MCVGNSVQACCSPPEIGPRDLLLDQAGATMARSQIELLGFVSSVEKICRKGWSSRVP
jgi:hypothetical protein